MILTLTIKQLTGVKQREVIQEPERGTIFVKSDLEGSTPKTCKASVAAQSVILSALERPKLLSASAKDEAVLFVRISYFASKSDLKIVADYGSEILRSPWFQAT